MSISPIEIKNEYLYLAVDKLKNGEGCLRIFREDRENNRTTAIVLRDCALTMFVENSWVVIQLDDLTKLAMEKFEEYRGNPNHGEER